ncbi:MAG: hypothetical protein WBE89_16520 [Methyloceanibacter sp.]
MLTAIVDFDELLLAFKAVAHEGIIAAATASVGALSLISGPKKAGPRSWTQAGFLSASGLIRWESLLPRLPPASIQTRE